MKHFLFLVLLFCMAFNGTSYAQYTITPITATHPNTKTQTYRFPKVTGTNTVIAQKINSFLLRALLELEDASFQGSIFKNVWKSPKNRIDRLGFINYTIPRLDERILMFSFKGEACGAYCEEFTQHYTFDLKTGDRITLNMLFTPTGQQHVIQAISQFKTKKINAHTAQLTQALQDKTLHNK